MKSQILGLSILGALTARALGDDILRNSGFTTCMDGSNITVQNLDLNFDRQTNKVTFNVAGSSVKVQKVMASLTRRNLAAKGVQVVPSECASQIPSIAFSIPDLEGQAKMEMKSLDGGQDLACIQSDVKNGKTMEVPAVSYIVAGVAGCALVLTGIAALGNAGTAGGHAPSPNFGQVLGWFQSVAINGMLSVEYPPIYRSFSKNFAFSGSLIPWDSMQTTIDNLRKVTGGNLTEDSVQYLKNATLVFSSGTKSFPGIPSKRGLHLYFRPFEPTLITRDGMSTTINGTRGGNGPPTINGTSSGGDKVTHIAYGIEGYVDQLSIPQANTFMTVLLVFAIIIATIAVGILLFKVILEIWALFASFPKKLTSFRKRYWGLLARIITNLILLLYGVWTLYCVYQFTNGDSWAAKILAGVTLGVFTVLLGVFTFRIWQLAQRYQKKEGDTSALFEDKETWRKYSLFYDSYKRGYWWVFMPAIFYMFAKGCVIAAGNGHGLAQTAGQLIIESLMLILVLCCRLFASTSGNWINAVIQVVRVLSVICILVFVEELGIAQSTKTVTGLILIVVQSVLTAVLAILVAVNAIIVCVMENPHRKQRKEAENLNRDLDNLTPLDARNTLLMDPGAYRDIKNPSLKAYPLATYTSRRSSEALHTYRDEMPPSKKVRRADESSENLIGNRSQYGAQTQSKHKPWKQRVEPAVFGTTAYGT